jgi:hypothetical protein
MARPHRRGSRAARTLERAFVRAYLAQGFNGAQAYQSVRPGVSLAAAYVAASRLLDRPRVEQLISAELATRFPALGPAPVPITPLTWVQAVCRLQFRGEFLEPGTVFAVKPGERRPRQMVEVTVIGASPVRHVVQAIRALYRRPWDANLLE